MMRQWRKWAAAACVTGIAAVSSPAPLSAAPACDEFAANGPAPSARITLDAGDLVDLRGGELRSFIDTGSLGRVDVKLVASTPPDAVRGVSAAPGISRASAAYGETLKGIAVAVALAPGRHAARVTLDLRQVCAQRFRNTFLYY